MLGHPLHRGLVIWQLIPPSCTFNSGLNSRTSSADSITMCSVGESAASHSPAAIWGASGASRPLWRFLVRADKASRFCATIHEFGARYQLSRISVCTFVPTSNPSFPSLFGRSGCLFFLFLFLPERRLPFILHHIACCELADFQSLQRLGSRIGCFCPKSPLRH